MTGTNNRLQGASYTLSTFTVPSLLELPSATAAAKKSEKAKSANAGKTNRIVGKQASKGAQQKVQANTR